MSHAIKILHFHISLFFYNLQPFIFFSLLQNVGYTTFKKKARLDLGKDGFQIKKLNSLFFMSFYDSGESGCFRITRRKT